MALSLSLKLAVLMSRSLHSTVSWRLRLPSADEYVSACSLLQGVGRGGVQNARQTAGGGISRGRGRGRTVSVQVRLQ